MSKKKQIDLVREQLSDAITENKQQYINDYIGVINGLRKAFKKDKVKNHASKIKELDEMVESLLSDSIENGKQSIAHELLKYEYFPAKDLAKLYEQAISKNKKSAIGNEILDYMKYKLDKSQKKEFNSEMYSIIEKTIEKSVSDAFSKIVVTGAPTIPAKTKKGSKSIPEKKIKNSNYLKQNHNTFASLITHYESYEKETGEISKLIQKLVSENIKACVKLNQTFKLEYLLNNIKPIYIDPLHVIKLFNDIAKEAAKNNQEINQQKYSESAKIILKHLIKSEKFSLNSLMDNINDEAVKYLVEYYNGAAKMKELTPSNRARLIQVIQQNLLENVASVSFDSRKIDRELNSLYPNKIKDVKGIKEEKQDLSKFFDNINNSYEKDKKTYKGFSNFIAPKYSNEVDKILAYALNKKDKFTVEHILKDIHPDIFPHESKIQALNLAAKNGSLDIADLILNNSRSLVKPSLIADKDLNIEARMLLITKGADPKDLKPIKGILSKEEISKLKEFKKEVDKFEKGLYRKEKKAALEIVKEFKYQQTHHFGQEPNKDRIIKDQLDSQEGKKGFSYEQLSELYDISKKTNSKDIVSTSILRKVADFVTEIFKSGKDLFKNSEHKKEIRTLNRELSNGIKGKKIGFIEEQALLPSMSKEDKKVLKETLDTMLKTGMKKAERDETVKETFKSKLEEKSASKTVNPGRKK
ncbi:MAG: hypothetical protein ACK4OM_05255 [Alphaproteobacteria bacterium]